MSQFTIDVSDLTQATEFAWAALEGTNVHTDAAQFVFRFGSLPSRFERNDAGSLITVHLNASRMRHRLSAIANFGAHDQQGVWKRRAGAPMDVVTNVLATPDAPLPVVRRVVDVPVLAPGGELHDTAGYSAVSQVFYEPAAGLSLAKVPRSPTAAQIKKARRVLVAELFGDFPFVGEAERAHAVAMALQPFLRDMIHSATPLYLVEAPTAGTGKGLLVDAACWAAAGAAVPPMTEGRDEDEWRKRVTSVLRESPVAILIDNLKMKLDSASMASVLTTQVWKDRILGASEMAELPNRCLWVATGNNPSLSSEMVRRSVRIRLDSKEERPEDRADFQHANLRAWAAANRGKLVWACLTLCRAWVAAGKPPGARTLGSYESWAHVMGGALDVAGVPGFLGNLDELRAGARDEGEEFGAFLQAWYRRYEDAPTLTKDLHHDLLQMLPLNRHGDEALQAGRLIGTHVDRRFGAYVIERGSKRGGVQQWVVRQVG